MKKLLKISMVSILLSLSVNNLSYAVDKAPKVSDLQTIEADIGKKAPEINIESFFNINKKSLKLSDLKGKVVILEFWATWCGPCLDAIPHIEKMQKEFKNDLVIIAITDEKRPVIEKYLKTHPTNLIIGIDSKRKNNIAYPREGIPHTILIDKEGIVKAITYPTFITNEVIKNMVSNKVVSLPSKKVPNRKFLDTGFNTSFFIGNAAEDLKARISISKGKDTQELEINKMSLEKTISYLHSDFSSKRIISNLKDKDKTLHLKVIDKGNDSEKLKLKAARFLETHLDLNVKKEKRNIDSYTISLDETQNNLKKNSDGNLDYTYSIGEGTFSGKYIEMDGFIKFLEEAFDANIINQTKIKSIDEIKLNFRPNDKESLITMLEKNGFKIKKENLEMDVLIISDKQ